MAVQKQDDQHEHTFSSYVRIRDVVLKTYLGRWTIGRCGERGSGISVLPAGYDDEESRVLGVHKNYLEFYMLYYRYWAHFMNIQWNITILYIYIYIYMCMFVCVRVCDWLNRVFASGLENRGSIPVWVIPKTPKMVLGVSFLDIQHYKVRIKGKVEQSRKLSSAFLYSFV